MTPYLALLYLLIFVIGIGWIIALIYWILYITNILLWYGVPNVTTPESIHTLLLNNILLDERDVFIDLWCGEWVVLEQVQKKFPNTLCLWYEQWFTAYKKAVTRKKQNKLHYALSRKDFFAQDISSVTVIYTYLMPHLMKKVWQKIATECKPWTLLYSNAFQIPDIEPTNTFTTLSPAWKEKTLYLYTVK